MKETFDGVWQFEVVRIGNEPVRISQCVLALGIFLAGLWLARRVSRLLVRRLASLPGVKPNAVAAVEKLVFYGLVLVVVAITLRPSTWTEIDSEHDRRIVESDVRIRIADLASEAGLSIAFPQRDLHLESASVQPIEVRVLAP